MRYVKYMALRRQRAFGEPELYLCGVQEGSDRLYHWGGSGGYMMMDSALEILKEYPVTDYSQPGDGDEWDAYERIYAQWCRDFPKKPSMDLGHDRRDVYAWISPDGKTFECTYAEHESLANRLAGQFYGSTSGSITLEERGLLKVSDGGIIMPAIRATQPQRDALFNIALALHGSPSQKYVLRFLQVEEYAR